MPVKADELLSGHGAEEAIEGCGVCVCTRTFVPRWKGPLQPLLEHILQQPHRDTRPMISQASVALEWATHFPLIARAHVHFSNGLAAQCNGFSNISSVILCL